MANYNCTIRSNYFRVNDEEGFKNFMNTVVGDDMHLFESSTEKGKLYGFGCYGMIYGLENDSDEYGDDTYSYDDFIEGLQSFLVEDDSVIIMESGNEKLRYVTGCASVITKNNIADLDLEKMAIGKAKEMLNNPNYNTCCEY